MNAATRAFPAPGSPRSRTDRAFRARHIAACFQRLAHALGHGKYAAVQISGHMRPVPPALGKALLPAMSSLQIRGAVPSRNDLEGTALLPSSSREALGVSTLNTPLTLRACSRPGSQLICGASTGTLRKASEDSSSSVRIKNVLRKTGCPLRHSTMTGLPVTKNLAGNAHAGLIHDLGAVGRAIGHAQAQRPCFRIENDQMRAQKPMPLGEKRKQGVKRRLEPTLRPHSCGDALQGFHVRDGIHQTGDCSDMDESKKGPAERPASSPLCAIGCINARENGTVGPPHP